MKTVKNEETILKDILIDLLALRVSVKSRIKTFKDFAVVVIAEPEDYIYLPGSTKIIGIARKPKADMPVFGVLTPTGDKVLVVLDHSIEGEITDEDLDFFSTAQNCNYFNFMTHKDLTFDDIFLPISYLIDTTPVSESVSGVIEYRSKLGTSILIRKGSNRHTFLSGKSGFLDSLDEFYVTKDKTLLPDNLYSAADSRELSLLEYMLDRLTKNPLSFIVTLCAVPEVGVYMKKAIKLREKIPSKITIDTYWKDCIDPQTVLGLYRDVNWDKVEKELTEADDTPESYKNIYRTLAFNVGAQDYCDIMCDIFYLIYLLAEPDTIEYIKTNILKD